MTESTHAALDVDPPAPVRLPAWLRLMRPKQWIKNGLVLAAPAAAGVLDQAYYFGQAMLVLVSFCLAASGTYCLNDAADVEGDRIHPTKRRRPVASGEITVSQARVMGVCLLVTGIALGAIAGSWAASAITALYVALTTSYTMWLKHIVVVDIVVVAAGFVIRAVAGVVGTDVPVSDWYLIVASFGALFLVTGKRSTELKMAAAIDQRSVLAQYTAPFLQYARSVSSGVAVLAYCLWAFEKAEVADTSIPWFQLSIVPMVVAVLRYALVLETEQHRGPEEILLSDRQLQVLGLIWGALFGAGVYLGHAPPLAT